jgi:hypothetical protein
MMPTHLFFSVCQFPGKMEDANAALFKKKKKELAKILFAEMFVQQAHFCFRGPWLKKICNIVMYIFLAFSC